VNPLRVLGLCGLASATLSAIGGFANTPMLLGAAGAIMVFGNVFALVKG